MNTERNLFYFKVYTIVKQAGETNAGKDNIPTTRSTTHMFLFIRTDLSRRMKRTTSNRMENEIINRVKAGETAPFEYLVKQYQGALFQIVANLVDHGAVEDIVQDVFLTAFSKIRRFDPKRGSFRTWLYRIARNRALNARRKKRERLMDHEPVIFDPHTPSRDLMVKEAFEHLDRELARLDFKERVIFVLAELHGMSYADIAQIEKIKLGTVKSRLARVREKLRRSLKFYME